MSGAVSSPSPLTGIDPQAQVAQLTAEKDHLNQIGMALQASHGQLQSQVATLQSQLAIAQQAQASPTGPTVPPKPHRSHLRIPDPDKFMGRDNAGLEVEEWLSSVERHIEFSPTEFPTEARKVAWATHYLGSAPMKWLNASKAEGHSVGTLAELAELMRSRYRPLHASVAARSRLDDLRQTGSVTAYNNLFLKITADITGMDFGSLIHAYLRGLKAVPQKDVRTRMPPVSTIHEAMNVAVMAEALTNSGSNHHQQSGRYVRSGQHNSSAMDLNNLTVESHWVEDERDTDAGTGTDAAGSSSASSDAAHELTNQNFAKLFAMFGPNKSKSILHRSQSKKSDAYNPNRSGDGRVVGVSKADYEKCRQHDACLKCKKSGHIGSECTNAFAPVPSNW